MENMTMPITASDESGAITITGNAINWYQVRSILIAADLYLKCGMLASRAATPSTLRRLATAYTGITYPRSRKGLERAVIDLERMMSTRTPDEVVTR